MGNISAISSLLSGMKRFLILLPSIIIFASGYGQTQAREDQFTTFSPPPTINLEKKDPEEETFTPKKKKPKKNVYYGLKTKKGFARRGHGDKEELILFNYLKEYIPPDPYVRDIYWYDFERGEIRKSRRVDPSKGVLLHGPYVVRRGDVTVEEGIFYIGTKHGRWIRKTPDDILIDKEKYYRGWPKESLVSFYDPDTRTKIKEIIPVEYGKKEGNYYYFFEDGSIAVSGEYRFDQKVGKWTSYYKNRRGRRKREVQYRKDPFDDDFVPYIRKEWNSRGKVIYDRSKYKAEAQ